MLNKIDSICIMYEDRYTNWKEITMMKKQKTHIIRDIHIITARKTFCGLSHPNSYIMEEDECSVNEVLNETTCKTCLKMYTDKQIDKQKDPFDTNIRVEKRFLKEVEDLLEQVKQHTPVFFRDRLKNHISHIQKALTGTPE